MPTARPAAPTPIGERGRRVHEEPGGRIAVAGRTCLERDGVGREDRRPVGPVGGEPDEVGLVERSVGEAVTTIGLRRRHPHPPTADPVTGPYRR